MSCVFVSGWMCVYSAVYLSLLLMSSPMCCMKVSWMNRAVCLDFLATQSASCSQTLDLWVTLGQRVWADCNKAWASSWNTHGISVTWMTSPDNFPTTCCRFRHISSICLNVDRHQWLVTDNDTRCLIYIVHTHDAETKMAVLPESPLLFRWWLFWPCHSVCVAALHH